MIFDINDTGGLVRIGPFAILWQNLDVDNGYPGFTTFNFNDYSLELGEIDAENGIYLTKYDEGDIEYMLPIVKL